MIKFCRIMVWISVVGTVASLGVLTYQIAAFGDWWWALTALVWGYGIFAWRGTLAQEVRSRDLRASFAANRYINR